MIKFDSQHCMALSLSTQHVCLIEKLGYWKLYNQYEEHCGVIDNACQIPPNGQALHHHVLISVKNTAASGGEKQGLLLLFFAEILTIIVYGHGTGCVLPVSHKRLVS